jgi:hypothetical protein
MCNNTICEDCTGSSQRVGCFSLCTLVIGIGQWARLDQFMRSLLMNDLPTCFTVALLNHTYDLG